MLYSSSSTRRTAWLCASLLFLFSALFSLFEEGEELWIRLIQLRIAASKEKEMGNKPRDAQARMF